MPEPQGKVAAIVLAAGHGRRMRSERPKVLHEVGGRTLIGHVLEALNAVSSIGPRLVVTSGRAEIEQEVAAGRWTNVSFVAQQPARGTADAVRCALEHLPREAGMVLIVPGDAPLVRPETLDALLRSHDVRQAGVTVLTARAGDPTGYGRVLRDHSGRVRAIVEERQSDERQKSIKEINAGIYAFDTGRLASALARVGVANEQGEYYLTDAIEILYEAGEVVESLETGAEEVAGVNSRADLASVGAALRERVCRHWMEQGVTIVDPASTFIDVTVALEADTTVHPFTLLEGRTTVGAGARLGPQVRIVDSDVGPDTQVSFAVVVGSWLGPESLVGPFASLRPGTRLERGAKVGTFVETKKTTVGQDSKAPHLSYLGDAEIGRRVNVGAGTITCNYDGKAKHGTVIEDDVYVSSDTMLVAPVRLGRGSATGAGAVVRDDVPEDALAVGVPARNIPGKGRERRRDPDPGDGEPAG